MLIAMILVSILIIFILRIRSTRRPIISSLISLVVIVIYAHLIVRYNPFFITSEALSLYSQPTKYFYAELILMIIGTGIWGLLGNSLFGMRSAERKKTQQESIISKFRFAVSFIIRLNLFIWIGFLLIEPSIKYVTMSEYLIRGPGSVGELGIYLLLAVYYPFAVVALYKTGNFLKYFFLDLLFPNRPQASSDYSSRSSEYLLNSDGSYEVADMTIQGIFENDKLLTRITMGLGLFVFLLALLYNFTIGFIMLGLILIIVSLSKIACIKTLKQNEWSMLDFHGMRSGISIRYFPQVLNLKWYNIKNIEKIVDVWTPKIKISYNEISFEKPQTYIQWLASIFIRPRFGYLVFPSSQRSSEDLISELKEHYRIYLKSGQSMIKN